MKCSAPTIAMGALLGLAAACSLAPKSDPSQFYVLAPQAESGTSLDVRVGLGPITLPAYLERSQLVTRVSEHRLELHEYHRWGEPLREGLARTLDEDLTLVLGGAWVVPYPWHPTTALDYAVVIDFVRFEHDTVGAAMLEAVWRVDSQRDDSYTERTSRLTLQAGGAMDDRVAALSVLVGRLAAEIGMEVRRLNEGR